MKRITILFLLLLTACAPVTGAPTADPYLDLLVAQAQITGTAQAQQVQITGWTATAQSWTLTPSPMPTSTPVPSVTPTPTINVTMTLAVEKMNQEIADMQRENVRKDATNTVLAWLPYLVFALVIGLALFFGYVGVKRFSMMATPVHEGTGKPMPMISVIDGVVSDIDRAPNGMAVMNRAYVASLPVITAERQAVVTNAAQLVDAQSRRARLPRALVEAQGQKLLEAPNQVSAMNDAGALFPLPDWRLMDGWQGEKNILPYGLTASGLGFVDVSRFPHIATIGATGEGKSRRFFRPLIAAALAAGHQVVIVGKTADYFVFEGHPNVTLARVSQITEPAHAERYAAVLKALVKEMNLRDEYLSRQHKSTWTHAGREITWIVLDELANVIRFMGMVGRAAEVQMAVESLVSEGRKVGFNVLVANQRATGMASILSQTGKAIFRVESDEEKAHKSLNGASRLREGYFFARFGDVHLTGAFQPSDEEIARFLANRPCASLERDWVDGKIVETLQTALPTAPEVGSLPEPEPRSDVVDIAEAYRDQWTPDMSGNAFGRLIGKQYGGSWKNKIDEIFEYLKTNQNLEGKMA